MHAVGKGQRRFGGGLVSRSSAIAPPSFSAAARAASSNSAMRRSVPTTPKRRAVGDVGFRRPRASSCGDAPAFLDHHVDAFDERGAGGHRRARADRGVAGDLQRRIAVPVASPCCAAMPRRSAARRGKIEAWPWPVDCTLSPTVTVPSPGNASSAPSVRRAAGMLQHAGNADAAELCRALPLRACAP